MVNHKLTKSKKAQKSKGRGLRQSRKIHTQVGGNLPYILDGDSLFKGKYKRIKTDLLTIDNKENTNGLEEKVKIFLKETKDIGTPRNNGDPNGYLFVHTEKTNLIMYYFDSAWFVQDLSKDRSDDYSYTASPVRVKNENNPNDQRPTFVSPNPPENGWMPNTDEDRKRLGDDKELTVTQQKPRRSRRRATTPARTLPQRRGATSPRSQHIGRDATVSPLQARRLAWEARDTQAEADYITGGPLVSQLTPSQRMAGRPVRARRIQLQ